MDTRKEYIDKVRNILDSHGVEESEQITQEIEFQINLMVQKIREKAKCLELLEEEKEDYNLRFFRGWNRSLAKFDNWIMHTF